jgi:RNA polymerase primary sigma factor
MNMAKKPAKPARKSPAKATKPATRKTDAAHKPAKPGGVRKPDPKKVARPAARKPAAKKPAVKSRPAGHAKGKTKPVAKAKPSAKKPGVHAAAEPKAAAKPSAKAPVKAAAKPVAAAPAVAPVKADAPGLPAKAATPPAKPSAGEIAARIAGKRAEDAAARKGKNGKSAEAQRELTPADVEARKRRLKNLIVLGKERGFLTYAEINDHLPDDVLDAEQIEGVISMIGDMGIQVYDEAPDADTLLMAESTPTAPTEDVEEEAEAAASTLDSEFGRTTDPVRMYMREMGSVELLTREGEIEIAKRIEDGLKHMIMAISACPMTVQQILELADKIEKDELKIDDVVDGLMDFNEELTQIEEPSATSTTRKRTRTPKTNRAPSRPKTWSA